MFPQLISSGQIIQLTCQSNIDGNVYYVIGKRFDKKCIYLVEEDDVENVQNFDNSFFEVERSQSINNKQSNQVEGEKDNKPIKFGDEIKFRHINSGKYLSVAREYTEKAKGSFKILLDEGVRPSEITFQIMPYRTFEKLADPIKYKAKVNIYNQQEEINLNIERNSKEQNQGKTRALIGSHTPDSQWEINLYSLSFNPINDVIRDKDLVYMVNSKSSGLLTLLKKNKDLKLLEEKQPYNFVLKQLPATYPIKKEPKSFDCIWQISIRTENHPSSHQMGKAEGPELKISFTHLIEKNQGCSTLITKLISSQEGNNSKQSSRKVHGETITSGEYIRIGKKEQGANAYHEMWLGDNLNKNKRMDRGARKRYHNRIIKELSFIKSEGESIVFQIVRIPEDLKKEIYQFIEAKQKIQSFISSLSQKEQSQHPQAKEQEADGFKEAVEIIKHINQSLLNLKNTDIKILQRQMILNDIGFISIIMECLQNLSRRDSKENIKNDQSIALRKQLHGVLRNCCAGNMELKLALSTEQHLLQLLKPLNTESSQTSDIETLKEIMKDNKYAIEHVMNQKVVKDIIHEFQKKTMQIQVFIKYIQILRLICKTTQEVIPRNQKLVIEELLESRNMRSLKSLRRGGAEEQMKHPPVIDFFFTVNQDREVNIITPETKLGDNKVLSEANQEIHYFFADRDHPLQYLACIEWIELISDVCENKNVQGKKFAEERFGPRVIEAFLYLPDDRSALTSTHFDLSSVSQQNNEVSKTVKFSIMGYIVRLVNNVFIKTIYRKKIFFDRIYISNPNDKTDMYPNDRVLLQESDLINKIKIFVQRYITALKESIRNYNPDESKDNVPVKEEGQKNRLEETTKNVFMLMKNMIMYGLYNPSSKREEFRNDPPPSQENNSDSNKRGDGVILESVHNHLKHSKGFMYDFLIILCSSTKQASSSKSEILEIINFYMNLDLRERVDNTIKEIKNEVSKIEYNPTEPLTPKKREETNRQMKEACQKIIQQHKPVKIKQQEIELFIIIMLSTIKNEGFKDKNDFILSLNTLSKFIQVNRIYTIRVKETLIINQQKKDEEENKLKTIREARYCFELCEIKDLKGISLKDQYQLNMPIWDQERESIIKYILTITQSMKEGGDTHAQLSEIYKNTYNPKFLISAYNELERPNPKIQKMMREMKLHRYFYSFIKDMSSEVEEELSNKLLEIIYMCLAVFTWKNYQNKTELSQLLPYMLQHAEYNNGSIEALKEFFSENPSILYDQEKITRVTERITNYIHIKTFDSLPVTNFIGRQYQTKEKLSYNFYYAAKLLDFLHSLIATDSSKQGRNRILVLSYILDKDRLKITRPDIIEKISTSNDDSLSQSHTAEVTYLSVLFGLLAELVDKQSINIAKCKKLHKLEVLVDIMAKMKRDVRLKASARDYVNKLYYVSMDNSYIELIVNSQLDTFIFDLNEYIYHRVVTLGGKEKYHSTKPKNVGKEKGRSKGAVTVESIYAAFEKRNNDKLNYNPYPKPNPNEQYSNPIRYTYKSTFFYLNLQRVIYSLQLIFGSSDKPSIESKKVIDIHRRLRFIYLNFFDEDCEFKKKIKPVLSSLKNLLPETDSGRLINTDLRIQIERDHNSSILSYRIKFGYDTTSQSPQNKQASFQPLFLINEDERRLRKDFMEEEGAEQKQKQKEKQLVNEDIDKIKTENYTVFNRIVEKWLRTKKKSQEKEEKLDIEKHIMSELKYDDQSDNSLSTMYNNILNSKNLGRQMREAREKEQLQLNHQKNLTIIQDQFVKVFQCINKMIADNYQIFQAKNLTFYFRTVLKEIKILSDQKCQKKLANSFIDNCLKKLADSFSLLMFRTITSCNLQENIEVSYWFFEFVAEYWEKMKTTKTHPQKLYKLIKDDYKNQFLIKLNDFIVFLSNDIYRKVERDDSERESPLRIFDLEIQSFRLIKNTQYGRLNKETEDNRIFKTFKNIFKFMQLLCENNFVAFKSQLREQKVERSIKPNNRNLLIRSTIELRKLFKLYNGVTKDLPENILDFINEIAQIPCYDNQIQLSKSTFFEDMCQFISRIDSTMDEKQLDEWKKMDKDGKFQELKDTVERKLRAENKNWYTKPLFEDIQNIIQRFFKILLSLLESNIDEIYQSLLQKLSPNFFEQVQRIYLYNQLVSAVLERNPGKQRDERNKNDSKMEKLKINMLIIRKQLDIKSLQDSKLLENLKEITKDNNGRYSIENIESIEVRLDDKEHKLYFFKPIEAEGIDKDNEFIQTIEEKLDRSTHLQKLDSLLLQRKNIEMFMVYQHELSKSKYSIITNFISLNTYASIVSVFINIIIMLTTSINIVGDMVNSEEYFSILLPFQIVQFILGTLFFFSDALNHVMKTKFDKHNNPEKKQVKAKPEYQFSKLDQLKPSEWIIVIKGIIPSIIYYFICILGLFLSPYYYSIHILFLFAKIKVLENVFKAITYNIYQLVYLALLGIAFFIVFSILSIDIYAPYAQQQYCNSIWQCFLVIYNKDLFIEQSQNTETNIYSLLFQILYSVFFGALFGNIISGLMTDTFAQLRDKENYITQDQNNFCYICGRSRFEIERENKDKHKLADIYEKHTMKHNKLSYVFYIYELEKKDKTEYTGLEYIISKRVEENSVVWFPIKKKEENDNINEIKKELEILEEML